MHMAAHTVDKLMTGMPSPCPVPGTIVRPMAMLLTMLGWLLKPLDTLYKHCATQCACNVHAHGLLRLTSQLQAGAPESCQGPAERAMGHGPGCKR